MDLPSKNMYDTFKDGIWRDLGLLDPDWFEALTAQTCNNEENVSDQDDLCANQEGHFKAPFDKTAVSADSQLFSTPKVFRHRPAVSPETENEQSFTAEQEKDKWTATESPCLFQMCKEEVPVAKYGSIQPQSLDSFDLLQTPQKSPTSYARQISESLGAQFHPDMTWTSSLNTPTGAPSTLILTKPEESPCPQSLSAERNVVLVRELFPSLSNASRVGEGSPENAGKPIVHQGVCSPEFVEDPECHNSPTNHLNQSDVNWKEKLPPAIEDGELHTTVASLLEGTENVPSVYFTNSNSALRKVKTDGNKRKRITPGCSTTDVSMTDNAASREQETADQEPGKVHSSPPVKACDNGITQWSPLSLSEIPSCTASCFDNSTAVQVKNNIFTEQLLKDSDSGAQIRKPLNITDSGLIKKRRKFIYNVKTPRQEVQGEETRCQRLVSPQKIPDSGNDLNMKQLGKAPVEADCCSINEMQKQDILTEESLPPPAQVDDQDLDMSQLCRDFAQDLNEMSDPTQPSKAAAVDIPQNVFSPSACLSAMKQAKQKAKQTNNHLDCDGISDRRHYSTTTQNNPISEVTVSDSGFQSAVTDTSHMTAPSFAVPSSDNICQSQECSGIKDDIHGTTPFLFANKENGKMHLDDILQEAETDAKLSSAIKESQLLGPDRESELHIKNTSTRLPSRAKGTLNNIDCSSPNGQICGSLPERTALSLPPAQASGFKTASNKGIHISSANLQKAKRLFEETEGERTFSDQPMKSGHDTKNENLKSHETVKKTTSNSNQPPSSSEKLTDTSFQLSASQKADVSELCTLLEEADSQFEFTPFKTAKPKQHCQDETASHQNADKELDPDFLAGIDFDDSFSLDAEKHQAVTVMHQNINLVSDGKNSRETSNVTSKSASLSAMAEDKSSPEDVSALSKPISEGGGSIMSAKVKYVNKAEHTEISTPECNNPPTLGVGFKTAGGNVVRVSKKCLSKAKALFADLEENLVTSQNSPGMQSKGTDAEAQHKQRRDNHSANVVNHKEDNAAFTFGGNNPAGRIQNCLTSTEESVCRDEQLTDMRGDDARRSFKNSTMDSNSCQGGFQMASGKGISITAKALQEANAFFKECDITDSNSSMSAKPSKKIEPLCKSVQRSGFRDTLALMNAAGPHGSLSSSAKTLSSLSCTTPKNIGFSDRDKLSSGGGFCTAKGENVLVSGDAVKKAERLLSDDRTPEDKRLKQKAAHLNNQIQVTAPNSGGFQTASGKGVAISSEALKKATLLFSECEEVGDQIGAVPTHSKMPAPQPAPRKSGFLSASGKSVALSAEALQKAKALFSDISCDKEIPSVSDTRNTAKEQKSLPNTEKLHLGFSTAGGARVHVSKKHLLKAKNILKDFEDDSFSVKAMQEADEFFKDCNITDTNNAISVDHKSTAHVGDSDKKKTFSRFEDLKGTNGSEKSGSGCSEFESVTPNSKEMKPLKGKELHKGFYENMQHSADRAPSNRNLPLMTKPLASPLCTISNNVGSPAIDELSAGGGFSTASGKKVFVSGDAMAKAKSLFSESATFESTNNQLDQVKDNMPTQGGGFQTASGKGVAITSAALKKAKTLLSECDEIQDKISVKPTPTKMPDSCRPLRNHQFQSASGKPVAVSSESLQKAKALLSDISVSAEIPAASDSLSSNKKQDDAESREKKHCGFTTAGGAKVHISHNSLLKAKTLMKEFADGDLYDLSSHSTNQHDIQKLDPSKAKDVKRTLNSDLATARSKKIPPGESFPQEVKPSTSLQETGNTFETHQNSSLGSCIYNKDETPTDAEGKTSPSRVHKLHDSLREDHQTNQTTRREGSDVQRIESSALCLQSLHLSGCTETQQKILAQEALDCTRALLEDECVAGQNLCMSTEETLQQDSLKHCNTSEEEVKGRGKRLAEDPDVVGQPPLKRRLLEDFDRTVDGPKVSTLCPETSTPNGIMKDRRVFKYSSSLNPNITRPHRNGNQYTESRLQKTAPTQHSAPGGSKSAQFKTPVFVPPFLKNAKTESRKNAMLQDNIRTPPEFVPPFKKQRTIVQESSSKPQEGEDKHCSVVGMPAKSNTYVPPTKNTQSPADRSGNNEGKDDNETVALNNTTKNNLTNNQNLPAGCGSEDSAAETSHAEDMLCRSEEMLQNLHNIELARDMQDMRIRKKKRQTIRPLPGSLFLTKTSGVPRVPLKAAVNGKPPARYTQKQLYGYGVHQHVCEITSDTAESFRFRLQQFIRQEAFIDGGGVQLADGGWLIPSNDGTAGKQEFYRALCDTPGVDPKLMSEEWVYNHYRWIVLKQASKERSFPDTLGSLCLTPEQVLLQLKYRYDVELDHSRRPALRRIMEKDDTAAKRLVLCVCGVFSRGQSSKRQSLSDTKTPQGGDARVETPCAVVWLTDGWYAIKAQLDEPLTAMLHKERLAVGGKLIMHGAQLVGSQDACSPLEAPESLMLKICANSSRPARWDVKLGFQRDPRPFLLPVCSLYSNGGPVGCVDMIILRSYPIQWMERKADGGVVFRSVRAEEKEARRYNSNKQKTMEVLFTKIQAEFEKEEKGKSKPQRRRQTISRQGIKSLQDGEELYDAVGEDPAYLEAQLSEQQLETLRSYRRSLMERKQAELQDRYRQALESAENSEGGCPKRDVTPVWRLCFADSMGQPSSIYQLNLWRPTSDLQSLLKEGCRYKVYNLSASDGKKLSGNISIQLTGTKKTQFQDLQASQERLSTHFQPRVSIQFVDLQNPEFQPLCGEVDLTGFVISIIDGQGPSPAFFLADGKLNFVKVRCFSSLAQSGLEDVVKPRVLLALSNLQLRGQSTHPTPVVYAGDLTAYSTNPKEVHLRESLSQLRNLIQSQENFFLTAEEKLSYLTRSDGSHSFSSLQTGTPASLKDRRQSTKISHQVRSFGSFTPVGRNPSSTNCSTEKDPSSLKRKRALDYLSRIPSPPPLAPLGSVNSSCLKKTFNPPRRSGTPSTLKTVQTPARKPVDPPVVEEWVNDDELAMIDTQALLSGDSL
ncbi:breast cancer type 2 susceptibility protein [Notolabrus celidotus]|uniref:breast cancer type 2 susceptibility protein n=1 Tax=Notolabrus celidotus TaxID=1203425 RepID=UPI00149026A5|nr:breast cancer type 2 susceptibility protein [Notolabrus celidotus]